MKSFTVAVKGEVLPHTISIKNHSDNPNDFILFGAHENIEALNFSNPKDVSISYKGDFFTYVMLLSQISNMPLSVSKISSNRKEDRKYQLYYDGKSEPESLFLREFSGKEINKLTTIKPDGWMLEPHEELLISLYP